MQCTRDGRDQTVGADLRAPVVAEQADPLPGRAGGPLVVVEHLG
jgi:hypothetical protein